MGTYCTHYKRLALWVGYRPVAELETEACRYLFQLSGLGYSRSFPPGGGIRIGGNGMATKVRHRQALRMCKVINVSGSGTPVRGTGGAEGFRDGCDGRAQWTVYGMAVLSFTCLLRVGEAAPIRHGGSRSRGLGFHTVKCGPHFVTRRTRSYGRSWLR